MPSLPKSVRQRTPNALRHNNRLRATALRRGLIPPRKMHTDAEADLLTELCRGCRRVVEIGVYEGSSAIVLARALSSMATLHLVDPFGGAGPRDEWWADARATKAAVERAIRGWGGPELSWHEESSQTLGAEWELPLDFVFIDGDHSEQACREDWRLWGVHVVPGGTVAIHDARAGKAGGWGLEGPTAVADELRENTPEGWRIDAEVDTIVVLKRERE